MQDDTSFHRAVAAVRSGDLALLRTLLAQDGDLVRRSESPTSDRGGYTLLHHAASGDTLRHANRREIAETLLAAGAPVDAALSDGATPLHFAASLNHLAVMEALLAAGASVTAEDGGDGGTPLVQALFYGCRAAAELLADRAVIPDNLRVAAGLGLEHRVDAFFDDAGRLRPEAGFHRGFYRPHDEFPPWTPSNEPQEILGEALVYAAVNGRLSVADRLMTRGARPGGKPYFATALHHAAWMGHADMVVLLMDRGADGAVRDDHYGGEPWGWAHYGGHPDLRTYILDRASHADLVSAVVFGDRDRVASLLADDLSAAELTRAVDRAYEEKNDDLASLLRDHGAQPGFETAARHGLVADAARHLAAGADPAAVLSAAAANRQHAVCRLLLEAGASPDLHQAAALGLTQEIEALLADGAVIDAPDASGRTALHHAIRSHAEAAVRLLLACGASAARSYDGFSFGGRALHVAAAADADAVLLDLLIAHGADVNQGSNEGTPLDTARREGNKQVARLLEARGGKTARALGDWPHAGET